jgi:hypothetical protein
MLYQAFYLVLVFFVAFAADSAVVDDSVIVDDSVRKTLRTGVKGVSTATPKVFSGDLRQIKPAAKWQPGDAIKVANPRHISYIQDLQPAVNTPVAKDHLLAKQRKTPKATLDQKTSTVNVNVDGMGFNGVNPPDPTGDVGLNYYIQSVNAPAGAIFSIHNKIDGAVVVSDIPMSSLHNGDCADAWGDPIVLFDDQANRWLLTEFSSGTYNKLCILVSQTDDPVTGG